MKRVEIVARTTVETAAQGALNSITETREQSDQEEGAAPAILRPGTNCWRVERASRATPLVDGAHYFGALREAMLRAERQIFILGWDIDSRMVLPRSRPDDDAPETLRDFINFLARRRPRLRMNILLWDFTIVYASTREAFPKLSLDWSTPRNVRFVLDDEIPVGGSHHQKVVVIDDRVAFVGGLDLTRGRWDTRDHAAENSRRVDHAGTPYPPFHDVQLAVAGPVARAVGDLCRWRWCECTGHRVRRPRVGSDPWPPDLKVCWRDVEIGIARTLPSTLWRSEVREILALHLDAIAGARRSIYIENQYLTAGPVAEALGRRLAEPDGPEVVIVTQSAASDWLEHQVMGARRHAFLARLHESDRYDRLRVLTPIVPGVPPDDYDLHSKVAVIDDRQVQIGSANLNSRSMGYDSECDLAIRCTDAMSRAAARDFRDGLVAEHLGCGMEAVREAIKRCGSIGRAIDALADRSGRHLAPLEMPQRTPDYIETMAALGDPEPATSSSGPLREVLRKAVPDGGRTILRRAKLVLGVLAVIGGLAAAWRFTPLAGMLDPENLGTTFEMLRGATWGGLAVIAVFLAAGFLAFPVTALVLGTAIAFGPLFGFIYATAGTMVSATGTYWAGSLLGKRLVRRVAGDRVLRVSRMLGQRGVFAVTTLRLIPIAPFTVINLVAGASHIRLWDFLLGTLFGTLPGIAVLAITGEQLGQLIRKPTILNVTAAAGLILLWLVLGAGLQWLVNRRRKRA